MNAFRPVLVALASLCLLATSVHAQTSASPSEPADQFFRGYLMKAEAEKMETAGDLPGSLSLYRQMAQIFDGVAQTYPSWQPEMLNNRRQLTQNSIARVQARMAGGSAAAAQPAAGPMANSGMPAYGYATGPAAGGATGGMIPMPGVLAAPAAPAPAPSGALPSFGDTLRQLDQMYQQRFKDLEVKNNQMESDLGKWQQWYQWASSEITTARADKESIGQRLAVLEKSAQQMERDAQAGRASSAELEALKKQRLEVEVEARKANQRLAAAENAAKDASEKLATASSRLVALEEENVKLQSERSKAIRDRDAISAQNLGLQTEVDQLKKQAPSGNMKGLMAENERLKKELETAQQQVVTLKADATRKDEEITNLRGQLTTLQGELATLRKQSAGYQTEVADLTRQLKELKEGQPMASGGPNELLTKENEMLRDVVMRQLRSQYRQQQAKDLVIAELNKMENASQDLLRQVEELKTTRMILTPDEEKLFTDPQVREMLGQNGIQATLIASAGKAASSPATAAAGVADAAAKAKAPAAAGADSLINQGNDAFGSRKYAAAAALYEDALRAEPKNTTAMVGLGLARQREGKLGDAEAALKKCLATDPDNEPATFALGVTMFKQQRWNDAVSWFEKSLEKRPQNASARHYLGILSTKLNLMERAEREFKMALAIDPNYGEAHFNLAVLYVTWDPPQWDKAQSEYNEAVKKGVKPDAALEKLLQGSPSKSVSAR